MIYNKEHSDQLIPNDWDAILNNKCELLKQEYPNKVKYDYPDELTFEQRYLFFLTQVYSSVWSGHFGSSTTVASLKFLKIISVRKGFSDEPMGYLEHVENIAKKYGVIQIQEPVQSLRPKLIIGCRSPKDGGIHFESDQKYHSHSDADTIDLCIGRNPTWVGGFGMAAQGESCHPHSDFLVNERGRTFYQTIYNDRQEIRRIEAKNIWPKLVGNGD